MFLMKQSRIDVPGMPVLDRPRTDCWLSSNCKGYRCWSGTRRYDNLEGSRDKRRTGEDHNQMIMK